MCSVAQSMSTRGYKTQWERRRKQKMSGAPAECSCKVNWSHTGEGVLIDMEVFSSIIQYPQSLQ